MYLFLVNFLNTNLSIRKKILGQTQREKRVLNKTALRNAEAVSSRVFLYLHLIF